MTEPLEIEKVKSKDGFYVTFSLPGPTAQTNSNYGVFFIVRYPCEVLWIAEVHSTAATTAGTVAMNVQRLEDTEALAGGDRIAKTNFNLKSTANTVVQKSGYDLQNTQLTPGDRLQIEDVSSPTMTSLDGLCLTLYLKRLGKGDYL